jgi:hypothetical protein
MGAWQKEEVVVDPRELGSLVPRMATDRLTASLVELPARAGELQRAGASAALIRELGDNYRLYHDFLAHQLEELGGDPDPASFVGAPERYGRHVDLVQRIVITERLLRRARGFRRYGRKLTAPAPEGEAPAWDSDQQLVDVEHPERHRFGRGWTGGAPTPGPAPRYPEDL